MPHCVMTQHFQIWYTSDPGDTAYTTFTQASDLAALYERVYATEIGYGYPAPADDGDGRIDVYVTTLSSPMLGFAPADNAGTPSSGLIKIDAGQLGAPSEVHVLAHELFHLIQYTSWVSHAQTDDWLFEGSAEWMGAHVSGFKESDIMTLGPSDMPLDCRENLVFNPPFQKCNPDLYVENGYSRWPFFEYLAQRFGVTFMHDVFVQGGAGGTATAAIQSALLARGTNLNDVYDDWSTVQMTGYGISNLDAVKPTAYASIETGASSTPSTSPTPSVDVNVDHLATRYVEFMRDTNDSSAPCFAATLSLSVKIPAGTLSKPTFYWDGPGSSAVPLSISGNVASASIPWDTCTWAGNNGYLALPNASTNVDTADFHVTYSLAVRTNEPATSKLPPAASNPFGPVLDAATAALAPSITVFGPELLKLSSAAQQIRLIVESSGEGSVAAALGSVALGSSALRPGENDLRFAVPANLLTSLRRSALAGATVLTLTPSSPDGKTTGIAFSQKISITPAANKAPVTRKKPVRVTSKKKHKAH